ncbi:fluoride efflux transporter FluC [Priestia megaterium]|jgi:CrcB protein|nr:CrcB family protein [Priestia megaterium]MDH3188900.1 CrcB family protein [Priestia megaterium]MDQ0802893.1 CrcB protein [Priestia megaterium]MED3807998.1 CrcB family protein [Priestia megaterium]MED3939678.1 CrcB family protein [Priestia megaterium]WEZ31370.1 CrcB family protein [Priestia megaterium]
MKRSDMMKAINLISIAFGAIAGTYARYLLNLSLLYAGYPIGTVIENLLGSFILGLLTGFFVWKKPKEWIKLGLGVGVCGGFTTYSTFAGDVISLTQRHLFWGAIYVMVSLVGGILLALAGYLCGEAAGKNLVKVHEVK